MIALLLYHLSPKASRIDNPLPPRLAVGPRRREADLPGEPRPRGHQSRLPDEDFAAAVRIAQAEFDKHQPAVVVGSSRGGAVAMNIDSGDARLVLLCPAWKKHGTAKTVKPGTVILHSRADDVVPFRQRGIGQKQPATGLGADRDRGRSPAGRPGVAEGYAGGV